MLKRLFSDPTVYVIILFNVVLIYLQTFMGADNKYSLMIDRVDAFITLFFVCEIAYKIYHSKGPWRFKTFIKNPWHALDFFAITLALPSLLAFPGLHEKLPFISSPEHVAGFAILRSFRIFKLITVIEFMPLGKQIGRHVAKAFKGISLIAIIFVIYTTIISLLSLSLFKSKSSTLFQNGFDSFFTIFRVFSGDDYSDIVKSITDNPGSEIYFDGFTKIYFVAIVFMGSILGISLTNSIFIDQMLKNAVDEEKKENAHIAALRQEIAELKELIIRSKLPDKT